MNKQAHFISDNTPGDTPNVLRICQREDGDIEISLRRGHLTERGVSVRANGSRLKNYAKIINLFSQLIDAINEEDIQFWVGKTVYQIVTENVPVDEHRMQWEEQSRVKSTTVTAAKIVNGKTCLYGQCNGTEVEITGEYFTSQEEAEDRIKNGPQYYDKHS